MKNRNWLPILLILSIPAFASAQVVINPGGGSGTAGTGGITAGAAASGCTINSIVYIDGSGNLACGGAPAPLYSGGTVTFSNGASAVSPLVVMDNVTPVFTIADGGTITGTAPYLGPLGSAANASFAATGGAGTGLYFRTVNVVTFVAGTVQVAEIDSSSLNLGQTKNLCWYPSTFGNPVDACINHEAAATFQLGVDVNGAAVAQTLKAHDGITGSNVAGANLTIAGGRGTGTGTGGNLILQTSPSLASGTTAHTLDTRQMIVAKAFALTDNTAATFAVVTLGNDTYSGGSIEYCIVAGDATTAGTECGRGDFSVLDVTAGAGGEVCTFTKVGTPAQALSGSTLAVTLATTTGTDLCNLRITADTNIATPTTLELRYQIVNPGGRVITPQ